MNDQFEVAYGCLSHHVHELGKELQAGNYGTAHVHAVELREHAHLLLQRLWAATHISGTVTPSTGTGKEVKEYGSENLRLAFKQGQETEREACATLCESMKNGIEEWESAMVTKVHNMATAICANAIRARKPAVLTTDEIKQRKQAAKDAGYENPMCASCAKMSNPTNKVCRECMRATPMFNAAVNDFLTTVKGTRQ